VPSIHSEAQTLSSPPSEFPAGSLLTQVSQSTHGPARRDSRYLPGYPCAFSKSISYNILRIMLYPSAPLGTSPRHFGFAQYGAPLGTASLDCETWVNGYGNRIRIVVPISPTRRWIRFAGESAGLLFSCNKRLLPRRGNSNPSGSFLPVYLLNSALFENPGNGHCGVEVPVSGSEPAFQ